MREFLDLKRLKRSKDTKHHTIYKKAHRIIAEKYETPELSEMEIHQIAKDFPSLNVKALATGIVEVRSVKDEWMIVDEGRFYTLYHQGFYVYCSRIKDKFHVQDVFKDLNYIFASIVSHDDYTMGIEKRGYEDLLDVVSV